MDSATMAMALNSTTLKITSSPCSSFINPLLPIIKPSSKSVSLISSSSRPNSVSVQCSFKEKIVTGLTATAFTASMVIPEVAQAAGGDVSPSLQNFLLSIISGGVVLVGIIVAIAGVSNFDPVKRG